MFTAPRRPAVLEKPVIEGTNNEAITAITAITANSSTKLKPLALWDLTGFVFMASRINLPEPLLPLKEELVTILPHSLLKINHPFILPLNLLCIYNIHA